MSGSKQLIGSVNDLQLQKSTIESITKYMGLEATKFKDEYSSDLATTHELNVQYESYKVASMNSTERSKLPENERKYMGEVITKPKNGKPVKEKKMKSKKKVLPIQADIRLFVQFTFGKYITELHEYFQCKGFKEDNFANECEKFITYIEEEMPEINIAPILFKIHNAYSISTRGATSTREKANDVYKKINNKFKDENNVFCKQEFIEKFIEIYINFIKKLTLSIINLLVQKRISVTIPLLLGQLKTLMDVSNYDDPNNSLLSHLETYVIEMKKKDSNEKNKSNKNPNERNKSKQKEEESDDDEKPNKIIDEGSDNEDSEASDD